MFTRDGVHTNLALLFNFAKRLRYSIAQRPLFLSSKKFPKNTSNSIIRHLFRYISCILLLIPVSLTHDSALYPASSPIIIYSQSYYYAIIASCLYFSISTLLLVSTLGATFTHKYSPSFATLTGPQRTLMLQTFHLRCTYLWELASSPTSKDGHFRTVYRPSEIYH